MIQNRAYNIVFHTATQPIHFQPNPKYILGHLQKLAEWLGRLMGRRITHNPAMDLSRQLSG